jgi:hypothetical protein
MILTIHNVQLSIQVLDQHLDAGAAIPWVWLLFSRTDWICLLYNLDLFPPRARQFTQTEFWLLEIGHILGVSAANVAVFGPEMGRSCDDLHNGSEFAVYTKRIYRMMANHGYSTLYCSTIDADGHVTTCSLSLVFTWFTTLCTVTTNQTCFNYSYLKAHSKDLSSQLSWWHRYLTHGC